ncbi:MAG: hypothetical protein RRC34_09270 [Lentisphaeria bacterium]|nr:hypothetical protein [Lentisphaeria bacterium]
MICKECNHVWDGDMSTCPECGFLAQETITLSPGETTGVKLKMKMRGQPSTPPSPQDHPPPQAAAAALPTEPVAEGADPVLSPANTSSAVQRDDLGPAFPADAPTTSYNLVSFTPERGAAPPPPPSSRPRTQRKKGRGLLLACVAASLALCLGLWMSFRTSILESDGATQKTAKTSGVGDAVSLNLANFSGQPLIVRIGSRVIALDNGQTMCKTIHKGVHDVSWRFTHQDKSLAGSLPNENVSTDANWRFVLESTGHDQTVVRTVETTL